MKHPRNGPCHCGSGAKYKKCHLLIERAEAEAKELAAEQARLSRPPRRRRISSLGGLVALSAAMWGAGSSRRY